MENVANRRLPRVLAAGGPNGKVLLNGISFGPSTLKQICRLFGFNAGIYTANDLEEFRLKTRLLRHAARLPEFQDGPLLVHINAEGSNCGMKIGPDTIPWDELNDLVVDVLRDLVSHPEQLILVLMTRGTNGGELGELLLKLGNSKIRLPEYLFLFIDKTSSESEKILAWTQFYGTISTLDFSTEAGASMPEIDMLRSRLDQIGFKSY